MKRYSVFVRRETVEEAEVVVEVRNDQDSVDAESKVNADMEAMTAGKWKKRPTTTRVTAIRATRM